MEYDEKKDRIGFESVIDSDFDLKEHQQVNRIPSINVGGSIFSSPSVSKDLIVFGCNDTFLYALDKNGEKQWSFKTDGIIFSSPTCYENLFVVGSTDGFVYCIDCSGQLKWKFNTGSKVYGTAVIVDGLVYIGSANGIFRALSLEDGKELWRINTGNEFWFSSAVVNDTVVIGNYNGCLYRLSKEGEILWKFQAGNYTVSTPLILDKNNNEVSSFTKRSFGTFPKAEGCRVIFGSGDGFVRCLDVNSGKLIWKTFTNWIGGSASFCSNKKVFVGTYDGKLYAIDSSGSIKWKFQTGNKIVSSPFVYRDIVFFGSSDNNLYAVHTDDGELLWRFLTDGEILSSPNVHNDNVYFGSWDGHLYALSIKDKTVLWKFATSISYPSFITRPHTEDLKAPAQRHIEFRPTSLLKGYQIEGSINDMGERTSMFYGVQNTAYKGNDAYRSRRGKY
ncbi:MAG TPA: PQQ-binding-like beta-propeller repeat protein [Candidatus Aenigmarchaeota archaeon]|nr:PQQ-binding-like beta-propeller repeat protein [Candidatus Aenigmarchaeota archaeon]